ncbi:MAG: polysaccharide pyruvyl transferase family protein [bacterium]
MTKAVVFNDTRIHGHFGCDRVMDLLDGNLARRGVQVIAQSPVRHAWWEDAALLGKIAEADILVINGEGTLHHGARQGEALIKLADHPARAGKPLYLINALYQENPAHWDAALRSFNGIWARDSRSARAMSAAVGREVGHFADLTLCDGFIGGAAERQGVVLGDSVKKKVTRKLAALSRKVEGATLVPIVRDLKSVRDRKGLSASLRRAENWITETFWTLRYPGFRLLPDQAAYGQVLGQAKLHVTGRFHGACFSVATQTPFVTLTSNSWKIEAMIGDCGLSQDRIIGIDQIEPGLLARDWSYSAAEMAAMRDYVERSTAASAAAFDAIATAK